MPGGVLDEICGEGGAESSPPRRLERAHVEEAAVAVVVEADRGRDVLAGEPGHEDLERTRVGAAE